MCGRFVSSSPPAEIARYFGAEVVDAELAPNPNVAPSSDVYVVYSDGGARRVDAFHWGLVPGWAKDLSIGNRMTNARAETVATKNAFKGSLAKRRCIVPAEGFYEWSVVPGQKAKQPYFIHRPDGEPLAFGGLWSEWRGELGGEPTVVRSTTIITTAANERIAPLHDRMPLMVPPGDWDRWLDPAWRDVEAISTLLVPAPLELVTFHAVSTEVNNARNKGEHLTDPVGPEGVLLTQPAAPSAAPPDPAQGSLLDG